MRVVFGRKFGKFMKFKVKQKLGKMVKLTIRATRIEL